MCSAGWRSMVMRAGRRMLPTRIVPRQVTIATLLAGGLLAGLWGCEPGDKSQSRSNGLNVILISIDTTRADYLACYGHPSIRTPHIDRLAAEGTLFTQCTTAAPVTLPSHTSMLTGTYPFVHKVRDNGTFRLHADNLTLAEALGAAGYATAAQVGAFVMNHEFGLDQGFADYRDVGFTAPGAPSQRAGTEITAEQVTDGAIRLLGRVAEQRFLLFVHYFDPHRPYQAPQRFAAQYIDPYAAEIAYADEQIGRLRAAIEEVGIDDRTLVVLTSDHGEGLGQHQESSHAYFVYESTLAVPLIFWCPGRIPAGARVAAQVRVIDIAPTILGLLGLPGLPDAQGVDLSPLISGEAADLGLDAYAETFYTKYNLGFSQLRSLRSGEWKYIHAPRPELYHLADDPQELNDLASVQPERVAEMRARLRALIEAAPRVVRTDQARRQASPQDLRRLESLGYVGGTPASQPDDSDDELALLEPAGPNPMEHVREIQLTTRAVGLAQTGQYVKIEEAIRALLAEFGERSRSFVWAHAHLAGALAAQGKLEEALEHFEAAVQGRPEDGQMHTMKGIVLQALGRTDEAQAAFERALTLEPVFAVMHLNLAAVLARSGQVAEATEQYRLAIEKDPLALRAYVSLAKLLAQSGQRSEAVAILQRGLEIARETDNPKTAQRLQALLARYRQGEAAGSNP